MTIHGNVLATGVCRLEVTRVIGNVFVYPGGSLVALNARTDGNLQCKERRPAPTGGFNRVGGNKEDQCASLQLAAAGAGAGAAPSRRAGRRR